MLILIAAVAALCSIAGFGTFILLELDSEVFYWSLTQRRDLTRNS